MLGKFSSSAALLSLLPTVVVGQLSGTVGPLTSASTKGATKTCDVTDYGAVADGTTDVGAPLASAWADCKSGGLITIPSGNYAISTWASLTGGNAVAIQMDGIITRTGTDGGNMIFIEHTTDFELFSSTSAGAMQGLGYEFHAQGSTSGPRLLRLYEVTDFSVHDIALTDSPSFHFTMDTCTNGEVYNMAIRGGNEGGLDGIDVWSTNIHIHDVEVTNKDECVTVKSPASAMLIEDIYCNWSGGCALGSLGADTDISNIVYRNIYTWSSNQMLMIKSNGGSGTVKNAVFENFIGHGNAYSLDIDSYWSSMDAVDGDGVQLSNLTFNNWKGTEADGSERGPIKVICADGAPCTDITISDFAMWTETGDSQWYSCESAHGTGACLQDGTASYAVTTTTIAAAPSGYSAASMDADLATAFGTTVSIPIPTIPTSFFPGATPISPLAGAATASANAAVNDSSSAAASSTAAAVESSSAAVSTTTPVSSAAAETSSAAVDAVDSSTAASSISTFPKPSAPIAAGTGSSIAFSYPAPSSSSAVASSASGIAFPSGVAPSGWYPTGFPSGGYHHPRLTGGAFPDGGFQGKGSGSCSDKKKF